MERMRLGFGTAVICCALFAGGCAQKHEVIKGDETLAPAATVGTPSQQAKGQKGDNRVPATTPADMRSGSPSSKNGAPSSQTKFEPAPNAGQSGELKAELGKVYFNFDSADLSVEARNALVKNANLLKAGLKGTIRVEGNCDERGSDDYNLALGEKRAKAAVQYLTNLGLPADRFTVVSYGKEKPAASGHDEASWAKNRRDEFIVTP